MYSLVALHLHAVPPHALAPTFPLRTQSLWMRGHPLHQSFIWTSKSAWPYSPVRSHWEILGWGRGSHASMRHSLNNPPFTSVVLASDYIFSVYTLARLWFHPRFSQFHAWTVACPRAAPNGNSVLFSRASIPRGTAAAPLSKCFEWNHGCHLQEIWCKPALPPPGHALPSDFPRLLVCLSSFIIWMCNSGRFFSCLRRTQAVNVS